MHTMFFIAAIMASNVALHVLPAAEPEGRNARVILPDGIFEQLKLPAGSSIEQVTIPDNQVMLYSINYDLIVADKDGNKLAYTVTLSASDHRLTDIEREALVSDIPEDMSSLALRVVPGFAITHARCHTTPEHLNPAFGPRWHLSGQVGDKQISISILPRWDRLIIEVTPVE